MFALKMVLISTFLIAMLYYSSGVQCGPAEYEVGGRCCLKCPAGEYVSKNCTENSRGECVACTGHTFSAHENGFNNCLACWDCLATLGLKTVKECTPSSDTVCGVLEGHYCIDVDEGGCRAAHRHTACTPGQLIKQPGTESTDTVCEDWGNRSECGRTCGFVIAFIASGTVLAVGILYKKREIWLPRCKSCIGYQRQNRETAERVNTIQGQPAGKIESEEVEVEV